MLWRYFCNAEISLRGEIVMRITLDFIDNIRKVKKKGSQKDSLLRDVEMMSLNIDEARDAIEDLKGRDILQCTEEDGMMIDEKERIQLAKGLMLCSHYRFLSIDSKSH